MKATDGGEVYFSAASRKVHFSTVGGRHGERPPRAKLLIKKQSPQVVTCENRKNQFN